VVPRAAATVVYRRLLNRLFWRQIEGSGVVFEMTLVGTIAKGFVLGFAAAAEADDLASVKTIGLAVTIDDLEISLDL